MKVFFSLVQKYKRRLPTVALVVGFLVDIVTFRTLNLLYAQIILATHLAIVACSIIVLALPLKEKESNFFKQVHTWLPVLQQYSTGNLLSAFLVLYSASGSLVSSWPFFALLALAIFGNETLRLKRFQLPFQTSLLFLNILLFSALAFPVASGSISIVTFLLSLVAGAVAFQLFRWALKFAARDTFLKHKRAISRGAQAVLVGLAVLYFFNLIPPIPLSLKTAEFYHSVERSGNGYVVSDQARSWGEVFFALSGKTLRLAPAEDAYFFSAVFAPARLDTTVVHRWEYFDSDRASWVSKNVVSFPITGGRAEGYRGFSFTEDPLPGRWRVSVETSRGQVVGRIYVFVERVPNPVSTNTFQQ